jgi:hypothetical protein
MATAETAEINAEMVDAEGTGEWTTVGRTAVKDKDLEIDGTVEPEINSRGIFI